MTKAIAQTYAVTTEYAHEYRLQITYALMAACALMALVYGMNLYGVISRTVALENVNKQIAAVSGKVQTLDAQDLSLSQTVASQEALKAHGLSQGQVSQYISRSSSGVALAGSR